MDEKVLQSLNDGPLGPMGPVKINYTPQNREANFQPVFKIYSHEYPIKEDTTESDTIDTKVTISGGADPMIDEGDVDDNI